VSGGGSPPVAVDAAGAGAFASCIADGGLAVFPADTVYGVAVDPEDAVAVHRLNALKRRDPAQPSGVMFFSLPAALAAADLGSATGAAVERLLPGPLTLVLPNPDRRFPLACGDRPDRLGIRVPDLGDSLAPLAAVSRPVLQSSANFHGGPDPCRVEDVPIEIRTAADMVLDGGVLPGVASTVVDLSRYEDSREHAVLREGAMPAATVAELLTAID
jgi:L-threonylcarbamoyladenylate synthase